MSPQLFILGNQARVSPNSSRTDLRTVPHLFLRSALTLSILILTGGAFAQSLAVPNPASRTVSTATAEPPSSLSDVSAPAVSPPSPAERPPQTFRPFSQIGLATEVGLGGLTFDLGTPLTRKFDLRAGVNVLSYVTSVQEQGADIGLNIQMLSSHAALDWFPFGGSFHLSPLVVFANNNRILATATVPSGSVISMNGRDYISSPTDPLHGSGRIDFRKIAPGFSIGFGSIIPRGKSGISIPVELGFYYAGQPSLRVGFTGSACDASVPSPLGCQSVDMNPAFQQSLAAFTARNNRNLGYARFFPIFSVGFAYRIW